METIRIGVSNLTTSRLAFGCWRIAGTWDASGVTPESEAIGVQAIIAAYEAGYTLFDNADIYCDGIAEVILGRALKEVAAMRRQVVVATKCGIRFQGDSSLGAPHRYDFSSEHIIKSCEQSLSRLGIETIDLYQLHRPDYLMNPNEVAAAFEKLKQTGKVKEFGVSNFLPSQVSMLQKACPMQLLVNQVEISLARLDCFTDGTLDQCVAGKITPLAWSPLAGGLLGAGATPDQADPNHKRLTTLVEAVDAIARARGATRTVIALAWLLKHPANIVPIIGSTKPDRIREAIKADALELSREEWYSLLVVSRGQRLP